MILGGTPALWTAPRTISYPEWCKDFGKYRWVHEDGLPRTLSSLTEEWAELFNTVTRSADMRFHNKEIEYDNIEWFTSEFLHQVPYSWLRFKTSIEFFFGSLTGKEMDANFFNGQVDRFITHEGGRGIDASGESTATSSATGKDQNTWATTYGETQGTSKGRSIAYNQGVQKYAGTELRPENIGELGRDYASGFTDTIGVNYGSIHDDNGTNNTDRTSSGNSKGTSKTKSQMAEQYTDHEIKKQMNYFPMLSYLSKRIESMETIRSFDYELIKLFRKIDTYKYFF